jgi:tetratricopeptide (TPR) repeat protein
MSNLALGETYLEMDLLDGVEGEDGDEVGENARAVFEGIRRDARYTPDSEVWMKALYRLGETYYRLGRRDLMRVREMGAAARDAGVVERAGRRVGELRSAGVDRAVVARQQWWARTLAEAAADGSKLSGLITRTRADARGHLRRALEILQEAHERYPPDTFGEDRPGFRDFLRRQSLASRRILAMVRFNLAAAPADLEGAHLLFAEILARSSAMGTPGRNAYRAEAYTFKGLIELKTGRHAQAAATFQDAFDEFSRSADGPWFAFAAGMALEAGGLRTEAARKYRDALNAYDRLKGVLERDGAKAVSGRGWLLPMEEWMRHAAWVRDTAPAGTGERRDG